jgi:hypothetical protein
MKEEEKYKEHVKKGWCFAQETASELANEKQLRSKLAITIFEKICSPMHYFIQNQEQGQVPQPPTEKQIAYAKQLGIQDPEQSSREELSQKIDEVLQSKRKRKK